MGEFRVVMEATTDDYEALAQVFEEASASIEQHVPGATGRFLLQEEFEDEDAADAYEQLMESHGFIDRAYDLFTSARVWILSPVTQPIWSEVAARPSSHRLAPVSGFHRRD